MSIQDGTHELMLSRPLKFKHNGESCETRLIVLQEPSMEHSKFYLRLKQMLTRSELEAVKLFSQMKADDGGGKERKKFQDESKEIEAQYEDRYTLSKISLEASETVDIGQFLGTFEKMVLVPAKKVICRVDDKINMTSALWERLTPDDAYEMALRWCAFFRYALNRGREERIRTATRIAYGTDGGVSYSEAINMPVWELSIINDELNKIIKEANRK